MAAFRRVDMTYGHLRADCLYTGISSGSSARYRVWEAFTFTFFGVRNFDDDDDDDDEDDSALQ